MIYVTNGCFDLLHEGHRHFFQELTWHMEGGDHLMVYVNDDASVRRMKGSMRPIISQNDRTKELVKFFDLLFKGGHCTYTVRPCSSPVIAFERDITENVSHSVVYAKDAESGLDGPEAQWAIKKGFAVLSIPRLPGVSTTDMINKILHATNQSNIPRP